MSRITTCFDELKRRNKQALIPYLTAGDPNVVTTLGLMHALVQNGADLIELGFPFSDPSSDGPVIQRAIERALAKKTTLRDVLAPAVAQVDLTEAEIVVSGGRGLGVDPVMLMRDFPIMVATTLACLPIFWTGGVITRLEGWILMGLYGLYVVEQLLSNSASNATDEFRLVVLVGVLPLLLVFFTSIGLSAKLSTLKSGGKPLLILCAVGASAQLRQPTLEEAAATLARTDASRDLARSHSCCRILNSGLSWLALACNCSKVWLSALSLGVGGLSFQRAGS